MSPRKKMFVAAFAGLSLVGGVGAGIAGHVTAPATCVVQTAAAPTPAARAAQTMQAFDSCLTDDGAPLRQSGSDQRAAVWPYGQAMAAALDHAKVTGDYRGFDRLVDGLRAYDVGDGSYAPERGGQAGERYYDDNAWIGLVFTQAYAQHPRPEYLDHAKQIFAFLQKGVQSNGGLLWRENDPHPTFNTCDMGPAIELAARLHEAIPGDTRYLQMAQRLDGVMEQALRTPEGLYRDSVNPDLTPHGEEIWSYNQGVGIGANVQLYRATGDAAYLEKAQQTARAALAHFGRGDALWKQPPAFNAIFFRNLLALDRVAPDARYKQALNAYTDRAWTQARDAHGLFIGGQNAFGHYEDAGHAGSIDQAAMGQLFSLQAWPSRALGDVG